MADSDAAENNPALSEEDRIAILAAKLGIKQLGKAFHLYKDVEAAARTFSRPASLRPKPRM